MGAQSARWHPLSVRYGLALAAFAAWRFNITWTAAGVELGQNTEIAFKVKGQG